MTRSRGRSAHARRALRAAAFGGLAAIAVGCAGGGRAPTGPPPRVTLDADAARLVPDDDGSQLAIFYGSELLGSLDGCGCMGNPKLGGLPYRFAFTEGFRTMRPGIGVLQLDAGASMEPIANVDGKEVSDFVVADDWVVTALDRLGFDAANLTDHEVPFLARYMTDAEWPKRLADRPVLARFVSANVAPVRAGLVAPPPYIVREVAAPSLGGRTLRVAIAGVSETNPTLEAAYGFRISDPVEALRTALPRARSESDLVVVLAYMPARQAASVVAGIGDLADVVVVANSLSGDAAPSLGAVPRVTYSWYKTQQLGVLRLRFDGTAVASASNAYVKLDDPLPRDPLAEELATNARTAIRAEKERRYAAEAGTPAAP
jgi:hypothetical protein